MYEHILISPPGPPRKLSFRVIQVDAPAQGKASHAPPRLLLLLAEPLQYYHTLTAFPLHSNLIQRIYPNHPNNTKHSTPFFLPVTNLC